MFDKLKKLLKRGGITLDTGETLNKITDHHRIAMPEAEYSRIVSNRHFYMQKFQPVTYTDSNGDTCKRDMTSINVAKIVARKLAKLVFNEGCEITVAGDKDNDFLQSVLADAKFRKNFGEELEAAYAMGGLALRPYVDTGTNTLKIAYCQADSFFPLQSNTNDVSEAAISTRTQVAEGKDTTYYTLLEFHLWEDGRYFIENELYRSSREGEVGKRVPLNTLDVYQGLEPRVEMVGFTRPIFVYIKLAGKNNANLGSPLGAGVIDNARSQLKDINDKYDQFMWEISKSATKIIASDQFFTARYDKNGRPVKYFDTKTDVFQRLKTEDPFIETFAPDLRATEFIDSINFILRIIEVLTGLSAGTFSFDGQSVKTATEIISENSETYSTRSDNVLIAEEALKELVTTIFELAAAYGLHSTTGDIQASVDFDDGVFTSKESLLEYNLKAVGGQLMPLKKAISKQFGLTEEEAQEWFEDIRKEQLDLDPVEQGQESYEQEFGQE